MQARTVGLEEEFLLVDQEGRPVPEFDALCGWLTDKLDAADSARFKQQPHPIQIEAISGVHTGMAALTAELLAARTTLAAAGAACGVTVLPVGAAPRATDDDAPLPCADRYTRIHDRYRGLLHDYTGCDTRVHVGVADPDRAVAVVNHLRPWLPTLLAVGANSPFHRGRDSGYSSWRGATRARFPGSGLPPYARSADDYDARIATLIECGTLVDEHTSFWLARPSKLYPTVEVRAADTAATVDDALLQAVLTRGLVQTALHRLDEGVEGPRIDEQVGAAAIWAAARYGLAGPAVDPIEEIRVPAILMLRSLVAWIADALADAGDTALAKRLLRTVERHGTGAARQRAAAAPGLAHLVAEFRLTNWH